MTMTLDTGSLRRLPLAAAAVSAGALLVAYASQYAGGLEPCLLCYYQRYAFMASLALALVLLFTPVGARLGVALRFALAASFAAGAAIALFHVGVEEGWWAGTAGCVGPALGEAQSIDALRQSLLEAPVVRCDEPQWDFAGITMAGFNLLFSTAFAATTLIWTLREGAGSSARGRTSE